MVPPSFVPETMRALDLLRSFLTRTQGMAIVVDEFGGTEGIVTFSDIIEDILRDAAPLGEADLDIEPLAEGRYLVNGRARLDDLSEQLGFDFDASRDRHHRWLRFHPARPCSGSRARNWKRRV